MRCIDEYKILSIKEFKGNITNKTGGDLNPTAN